MRDYGNTNAAPYASAPAVGLAGDTYWNTTQKVLYLSDGSTWVVPSIPASAVRGTPSSGGTAREIAKASIWAGDDLIDLSIPTAKLAAGAVTVAKLAPSSVVRQVLGGGVPANSTTSTAFVDLMTVSITTSGGQVLLIACPGWWMNNAANTSPVATLGWARDQVTPNVMQAEHLAAGATSAVLSWPMPAVLGFDGPAAGAHVYHLVWKVSVATATLVVSGGASGIVYVVEFA